MHELIAWDLLRQHKERVEHAAEHARLVREARPRRRRDNQTTTR